MLWNPLVLLECDTMALDRRLSRLETAWRPERVPCTVCGRSARSGGLLVVPVEQLQADHDCPSCGTVPMFLLPDNGRNSRLPGSAA